MSRIGKENITIPEKVQVKLIDGTLSVSGPNGSTSRFFRDEIGFDVGEKNIILKKNKETKLAKSLWGTYAAHTKNMLKGVTDGHQRILIIEGVGYKVSLEGSKIILSVGFSHKVELELPKGVSGNVEKNTITLEGVNKEDVTTFAAKIRSIKKPEPYKGKGIRYNDEVVRRKEGKKAST